MADPEYKQQDTELLAAYEAGAWRFLGIRAEAIIKIPYGSTSWIETVISLPGIWSVDHAENFEEIYQEERATLIDMTTLFRSPNESE